MPVDLSRFVIGVQPDRCVLFLGAGAAITSGAPSVAKLIGVLASKFKIDTEGLTLREISTLIEKTISNRRDLVGAIRPLFRNLQPTGGLLNLPLFDWKGIYTTNYDTLVEQSFKLKATALNVFRSNFDFSQAEQPGGQRLFKLHGSFDCDVVDGSSSRMILTDDDYELAGQYRDQLYDRLKADLIGGQLIIIGHSLADPHIKEVVDRAVRINSENYAHRQITILVYQKDPARASLMEARGLQVVFGGVDEFFGEMARRAPESVAVRCVTGDPLDAAPVLNGMAKVVSHALSSQESSVSSMFNGWPASYGDINAGFTFERTIAGSLSPRLVSGDLSYAVIAGASGVGKTTASRQIMAAMAAQGFHAWEHEGQVALVPDAWRDVATRLASEGQKGILFVDDASTHINDLNRLIDHLSADGHKSLRILMASARASWAPRIKSHHLYREGEEHLLRRLDSGEVDRLLTLVDNSAAIKLLVEAAFKGFSRYERRRRLIERCESDFFVCMRNIFASENFDDIVLREYASLGADGQLVYRIVAALESAGVQVHRQLVLRLLKIPADQVGHVLTSLSDIILERTVDHKAGIYGWIGRHQVISTIIAKYKFADQDALYDLLAHVIEQTSPTYSIEVRSLRELCASDYGIPRISDRERQNVLYRMVMSVVPGERVPRHKLIRNLIRTGDFEGASTEIRIFERDFREDGPVARYKIDLMIARAESSPGLLREDRVALMQQAVDYAATALNKFYDNKYVLNAYATAGVKWFKMTGDPKVFDAALDSLRSAEERTGDPEITSMIVRYSRMMSANQEVAEPEVVEDE